MQISINFYTSAPHAMQNDISSNPVQVSIIHCSMFARRRKFISGLKVQALLAIQTPSWDTLLIGPGSTQATKIWQIQSVLNLAKFTSASVVLSHWRVARQRKGQRSAQIRLLKYGKQQIFTWRKGASNQSNNSLAINQVDNMLRICLLSLIIHRSERRINRLV